MITVSDEIRFIARSLVPGTRVQVIRRQKVVSDESGDRIFYTDRVVLWKDPGSPGPFLAKRWWKHSSRKRTYKDEVERYRGPILFSGTRATVVGWLPDIACADLEVRSWALLLSDDGRLGWCWNIDGLRVLNEDPVPVQGTT